jgi:hypothetical protein
MKKQKNLIELLSEARNRRERRVVIFLLVKLGFSNLTPLQKVKLTRHIIEKMTGNANFTTPTPTLASVGLAADAVEDAENALDGTKAKTSVRNTAVRALNAKMRLLQGYVESASNNDPDIILTSGMAVRHARTKVGILPAPVGITAKSTEVEGQVKLKCQAVPKKAIYRVEAAPDFGGPLVWQVVAESTKATILINNLNPGQRYYFRIYAVNAAGASGSSEPIGCRPTQY